MMASHFRRAVIGLSTDDSASQIVELAVSLPLLIVMVVGIFDFSGAFTLKQKLANAARDAARVAAADPYTDVGTAAVPLSVLDAFHTADNYLLAEKINDCGITPPTAVSATALTWTSTGNTPPPCNLTLSINRGWKTAISTNGTTVYAIGTQVTIQYLYKWRFNSVITLLVPSGAYPGTTTLQATSIALNEN